MKKILLLILTIVTLMAVSYHVSAGSITVVDPDVHTSFDFGAEAHDNERGASSMIFTESGITLTTSGYYFNDDDVSGDTTPAYAYLDHDDDNNAGLGVCKELTNSAQCAPADDNVTPGEVLKLVFDQEVIIDSIVFKNGSHDNEFDDHFKLKIGTGDWNEYDLKHEFDTALTGTTFEFWNDNGECSDSNGHHHANNSCNSNLKQFYINKLTVSAVPIPAAVWLFGTGLLGLVAVARRKV